MFTNDREYSNGEIKVFWKPSQCIHSTICFSELPEVFRPGSRPWVEINAASTERIIEVVDRCPTSALTWEKVKNIKKMTVDGNKEKVKVTLVKNGPVCISGDLEMVDENGNVIRKEGRVSICRCGKSEKMPFCDGSHNY